MARDHLGGAEMINHLDGMTPAPLHSAFFEKGVGTVHGRLPAAVDGPRVRDLMDRLRPSLNLAASRADPYGVFYHPR